MNLGEAIKAQRKRLDVTQSELARACAITPSYLSMIEKNKKEPNLATLKRLSDKVQIPLPVLFFKSLDKQDIPESKRDTYNIISPSLDDLVNKIFLDEPTNTHS